MSKRSIPPDEEVDVGLEVYLTSSEPLGGKLKRLPEDFVVNEILKPPKHDPDGKYVTARIESYNWETNRLIRSIARRLGISRNGISFAGTKDKRAITTQYFSINSTIKKLDELDLADVHVIEKYRSNRKLEIGDLKGNQFRIKIKSIDREKRSIEARVNDSLSQLNNISGFPNFFGIQRFGIIRSITHRVGEKIVKKDLEKAVFTYIGNPCEREPQATKEARERIEKERDFKGARSYYPDKCTFELMMIDHLSRNENDWAGALETLPLNLKMMFIHAYQSYLFNLMLSQRIKKGIPLNEPIKGDIVIPLNNQGIPDHHRPIKIDQSNMDEMTTIVRKQKGFVTGLIMGTDPVYADGEYRKESTFFHLCKGTSRVNVGILIYGKFMMAFIF